MTFKLFIFFSVYDKLVQWAIYLKLSSCQNSARLYKKELDYNVKKN